MTLALLAVMFLGGIVATLWSFALAGWPLFLPALFLGAVALMLAGVILSDGAAAIRDHLHRRRGRR